MISLFSLPRSLTAATLLLAVAPATGVAQEPNGATDLVNRIEGAFFNPESNTLFRLQHIDGQQLGDTSPFTMGGATRFVDVVDGVLMLDGQGRITNDGEVGASFGGVRRALSGDSIFGAGVWLDVHQSPGENTFQQIGTSLEWFRDEWSARANGYFPVGNDRQTRVDGISGPSGLRYQGNNIVFGSDVFRIDEVAMNGVELEVARNVFQYDAEVFAGWYHWHSSATQTDGFKAGTRGYLTNNLAASVTVADDPLFGTNVFGGLTFFFGGGIARPAEFSDKLRIPVERNHLVAIRDQTVLSGSNFTVLTDPVSTQPILVEHLDSTAAAGGDGTFESPLNSLDDLFANSSDGATTNGNIAFAHSGSVFTGQSASLRDNQRFLGEGIAHTVDSVELGTINLPDANGPGTVPLIASSPADAITLGAMGNEVSGFTIDGGTRAIVNDTGATDTNINRVTVQNTTGDGIVITPSTSTTIDDVTFSNVGGQDIVLNASDSTLTNIVSTNAAGGSIFLQNLTGTTTLNNINITGAGGTGAILLDNAMAGSQTNLTGISVTGGTEGLSIANSASGSALTVNDITVTSPSAVGIDLDGVAGTVDFVTATVAGDGTMTNGVDVQNSTGTVNFETANVSGSDRAGVLVDGVNQFNLGITGSSAGDGGTISDTFDAGILVRDSNVDIRFVNILDVDGVTGESSTGDGIRFELTQVDRFTALLQNNDISDVFDHGIEARLANSGTSLAQGLDLTITGNQIDADEHAILVEGFSAGGNGFAELIVDDNTLSSVGGRGLRIANAPGQTTVKSLQSNVVTSGVGGFTFLFGTVFDSDLTMGGFQAVSGGNTVLGSASSRLTFHGLSFADQNNPYEGVLQFDTLQAFLDDTRGISFFQRPPAPAMDFELEINGGVIDVANSSNDFINAVGFRADGAKLAFGNLNINMNGATAPAFRIQNNGGTATQLEDLGGNSLTNVPTFKLNEGGTFSGTIDFGGGNTLP